MTSRRHPGRRAKRLLLWTALMFVGLQVGLNLAVEVVHPELYDPEYRDRLVVLKDRVRENPAAARLVVIGSSRVTTDFRPEVLPPLTTPAGEPVLPFNLSHTGAGPLMNLTALHRLEREGLTPRWAVIELVPALLGVSGQSAAARVSQAGDLPVLRKHVGPGKLYGWYAWERLAAGYTHCDALLRVAAPGLLYRDATWDVMPLGPLGGTVRWNKGQLTPDDLNRFTSIIKAEYFPNLQRLHLAAVPDRATRDALEFCKNRNVGVVLLLAPESSEFRSWYPPAAEAMVNAYCDTLAKEYGVTVIDARGWLPDDDFVDGHHVYAEGADAFTRRLGDEVLQPLVAGP